MYVLGTPGGVCRPNGFLEALDGGTQIPITGFDASFGVGSIPIARVGVIPELLDQLPDDQDDKLYRVRVRDGKKGEYFTLFKGYVAGDVGRRNEREFSSGINLIHPARDLDQMRLSAPSLHPDSADDWSYQRQGTRDVAGGGSLGIADLFYESGSADPLPKQVIDNLIKFLDRLSVTEERGVYGFKEESYEPAKALLKKITVLNGRIKSELAEAVAPPGNFDAINTTLRELVINSFASRRSLWDTVSAAFGEFGLVLICDNAGSVFVSADTANFLPDPGNVLDGDYILSHDYESRFARRIREVMLISTSATASVDAGGAGGTQTSATIACWPPPGQARANDTGATLSLQLPAWLTPISYQVDPESLRREPPSTSKLVVENTGGDTGEQRAAVARAQQDFARMLFYLESDKLRTFSVVGPLAPTAVPGTNAYVSPYSAVHAKSGKELKDVGATYSAYCCGVSHHVECQGRAATLSTSFQFRNVSRVQDGLNVSEHPIFSDVKPFPWRESASDRN